MFHLHLHILIYILMTAEYAATLCCILYAVCTECLASQWSGFYVIFCMLVSKECVASQWSGLYAVYLQLSLSIPGDSLYRGEM